MHRRLSSGRAVARVRVGPLDEGQRTAIADFFGMAYLPGEFVSVAVPEVEAVVREVTGSSLREVVAGIEGPIGDRAADRERVMGERNSLWEWLFEHEVVRDQPALLEWAEATRRAGVIGGSVERTRAELEQALRVIRELPGAGTPLPVFAETVLGDPHGLDEGQRVQGLVVRALVALYGIDPPTGRAGLRALWERAGLAGDELSSTVLTAGLRVGGDSVVARVLDSCVDAGLAAVLTLQQLRAARGVAAVPRRVWVVENPSVIALAVTRFGVHTPPLVCTSGWPRSAAVVLLRRLADAGTDLYYHGDFDGEGLRIAAHMVARLDATPWRMTSADYLAALGVDAPPVGRVSPVPWDLELSEHLLATGRSVPEERVAPALLDELARTVVQS
ncbi:TIGR02679 family protein [Nocardia sp. ET3-3]|uniref:TIGR02679 family protein n=1 Tax=Nocardia terrae TaxID=2675851 RepID=A0A7K1V6L3_9NOCA|nr:TIGR02679 family protein [Nocardia terrae]